MNSDSMPPGMFEKMNPCTVQLFYRARDWASRDSNRGPRTTDPFRHVRSVIPGEAGNVFPAEGNDSSAKLMCRFTTKNLRLKTSHLSQRLESAALAGVQRLAGGDDIPGGDEVASPAGMDHFS